PGAAAEVMNAFQASMRQFLDYQARAQEQRQALMQQFLQTQASIVGAFLHGSPAAPPPLPAFSVPAPAPAPPWQPAPAPEPSTNGPSHPAPEVTDPVEGPAAGGAAELLALPPAERAERLKALLLELVGERTGYPQDMLELDHNMEADLGIDSIKRTEIFGA